MTSIMEVGEYDWYGYYMWKLILLVTDIKNEKQVREQLESKGCQIRSDCKVHSVLPIDGGE